MRPAIEALAPTRLDFGGGWTDVPPYPEERGGFVCAVAISRYARARLTQTTDIVRHDGLVGAALRRARVTSVTAELESDFPLGAGLGGSSAAGVALAAALARWTGADTAPERLAEWSRAVEVEELGIAGGRQDHYAAAFGGALGLTFADAVGVERIPLERDCRAALEARCLLFYTGESRISSETITAVLDAYNSRVARVLHALDRMQALARGMAAALRAGDIDALGAQVGEHWVHQRALHPAITTPRIEAIAERAGRAGAIGMKALGASGGGCVIVFATVDGVARVADAVSALAERLSWRVDEVGVRIRDDHTLPPHAPIG